MSGALSAGANIVGSILSFVGQQQTNAANAQQAYNQIVAQQQSQSQAEAFNQDQASQARAYNSMMVGQAEQFGVEQMNQAEAYDSSEASMARDFNAQQADLDRQFQASQAANQMGFQWKSQQEAERYDASMANTAYQRGVADMKAAGINPILAAGQGAASSPTVGNLSGASGSGVSASSPSPTIGLPNSPTATSPSPSMSGQSGAKAVFQNPMEAIQTGLSNAVSSAMQASKLSADLQSIAANIDNTKANTLLQGSQMAAANAQATYYGAQTSKAIQDVATGKSQAAELDADAQARLAAANASNAAATNSSAQAAKVNQDAAFNRAYGRGTLSDVISTLNAGINNILSGVGAGGARAGPAGGIDSPVIDVHTSSGGKLYGP